MSRDLPDRPNLEQYRKQAKELLHEHHASDPAALERIKRHHPTLHKLPLGQIASIDAYRQFGLLPTGIRLTLKDGAVQSFIVFGRKQVIDAISGTMA